MVKKLSRADIPSGVEHWPDCEQCSKLCDITLNVCMEGEGPVNAGLMIIGEFPGSLDDELNRPLVDTTGQFLRDELLVAAGIPESKVRFTNAIRCRTPKNRKPSSSELKKCRQYLELEIERVKPKVIVGLGNAPLATVLQRFYKGAQEEGTARKSEPVVSGINTWRGKQIWLREFNCWFIPTFSPDYCMLNESKHSIYSTNLVIGDLKLALKLTEASEYIPSLISIGIPATPSGALKVVREMIKSEVFAFDIETGLNSEHPEYPDIIGCSFANCGTKGYYFSWDLVETDKRLNWVMRGLLGNSKLTKIMHNGAFEVRVLRFNGIPIYDKYFDTMISAHMVDENFTKRLKDLAWTLTDFGGYDVLLEKYKSEHKIKADYSKIPFNMISEYGALDSVATWIIYEKTKKQMEREHLMPLFKKVSMPVRRVMSNAEYSGIYVDKRQAEKVQAHCNVATDWLEKAIYKCAGKEFNIGSPQQLQQVLYKTLGFKPLKKTKTGYSTDAESIEYIATQKNSDIAKFLSDLSYVKTMRDTHIGQALEFRWASDGRIHAHYNLTGTVTGRASCSAPSLQNVPADALIRSVYTATPGNYLIDADLKSAELATIAAISGETTFLEAFDKGMDPHSQTYRRMYDLPSTYTPTKLERRIAKTINFGLIYGITAVGLARRLNITIEEAQEFMELYFERLPRIHRWMEHQKLLVRRDGYVTSVFNRKRRLPMGLSDSWYDQGRAERQAMNAPVQSGAADYTYIGLVRLDRIMQRKKFKSMIVHTVHDCGLADVFPEEKDELVEDFRTAFEAPVKAIPVKMKLDIEVGYRWGEDNESRLSEVFEKVGLSKITT